MALYILTGPQMNAIGFAYFSPALAADDLDVSTETIRKGLADVRDTFGWLFDSSAQVIYVPSWWRWNTPENANVMKGILKALNEIPASRLSPAFAANLRYVPPTLHETFIEGCRERLAKPSPIQEQEKRTGEEKQEKRAGEQEPEPAATEGSDDLLPIAQQIFTYAQAGSDMDTLLDTFQWLLKQAGKECKREHAVLLIQHALLDREWDAALS